MYIYIYIFQSPFFYASNKQKGETQKNILPTIGPKPIKYLEIHLPRKVQENNKILLKDMKQTEPMENNIVFQDRMTYYHKNINPFKSI